MAQAEGVSMKEGVTADHGSYEAYTSSGASGSNGSSVGRYDGKEVASINGQRGSQKIGSIVSPYRPELMALLAIEL